MSYCLPHREDVSCYMKQRAESPKGFPSGRLVLVPPGTGNSPVSAIYAMLLYHAQCLRQVRMIDAPRLMLRQDVVPRYLLWRAEHCPFPADRIHTTWAYLMLGLSFGI